MTAGADFETLVQALGLPSEARVEMRVPKKLLIEQGAPTAADKRVIGDGIEELQWFAAVKRQRLTAARHISALFLKATMACATSRPGLSTTFSRAPID